jgi:hypothetical protein
MARTHLQQDFVPTIDKLNDQLWYFLFASEELNKQISSFSTRARENYTTDLFHTNPYSSRIHIPVAQLLEQQQRNKQFTFGSYFSSAYETFSYYLRELFQALVTFNGYAGPSWRSSDGPERNIERLIHNNGLPSPPIRILRTIGYLRYKRNHFTHLATSASPVFTSFARLHGADLNNDWVIPKIVTHLDFTATTNPSEFTQEGTIDLFKILRIVLIELDEYTGGLLDIKGITHYLANQIFGHESIRTNLFIRRQRTSRIQTQARMIFQRKPAEADCTPFVATIGVR